MPPQTQRYKLLICFLVFFGLAGILFLTGIEYSKAVWGSSIEVCTGAVNEPACYMDKFANPTVNWSINWPPEVCDDPAPDGIGGCNETYTNFQLVVGAFFSGGAVTSFTVPDSTGLPINSFVTWRVSARDALGTWTDWASASFTTNNQCVPTAPSGLSASAYNCATHDIAFNWSDNSTNEDYFRVERRMNGGGWQIGPQVAGTSWTDPDMEDGANWEFRVAACNDGGCAYSPSIAASYDLCTPLIPTVSSPSGCESLRVTWDSNRSINETGYIVHLDDLTGSNDQDITVAAVGSWESGAMVDGTRWSVTVEAFNALHPAGTGHVSPARVFTSPLCAPTGFNAVINSCNNATFTWTDNSSNEQGYRVYGNGAALPGCTTGPNGNNVTCTIPDGTNWATMYVRAYNATGESANSNSVARVTQLCVPTGVSINSTGCRNLSVSWNDVSVSNTSYILRFTDAAGGAHNFNVTLGGGATNWFSNAMAFDGVAWTVTVEAFRAGFVPAVSAPASRTTAVCTPTGFNAVINSCNNATFSWTDNSSNEQGYRVYGNGAVLPDCTTGANSTGVTCTIPDGTNWATMYVRAYNATGDSANSNSVARVTQLCVPTGVSINSTGCRNLSVSWNDVSVSNTSYNLHFTDAAGGAHNFDVIGLGGGATSWSNNAMAFDGVAWTVTVEAVRAGFASAVSAPASRTTAVCTPTAFNAVINSCNNATFTWTDNSSNEQGYRVYGNGAVLPDCTTGPNGNNVTCTIPDGTNWATMYVRAYNATGDSANSNSVARTTEL
ncbi:MAG: hypothetical protein V1867_02410, partial [Candidatus Falkowbacteria bacterium]